MGLLDEKVVIVTGASSGIGEKTAEVLAAEGAKVVLAARRLDKLKAVDQANEVLFFASDLSKAVTGQALVVDYGCNL